MTHIEVTLENGHTKQHSLPTGGMRVPLKVFVEDLERLWGERGATFAFLRRLATDELRQVLHAVLVALLRLRHPPLQHRLDLLRTLWCDVQLLKSGQQTKAPGAVLRRHGPFVAFYFYCKFMLYGINYAYYSVKSHTIV